MRRYKVTLTTAADGTVIGYTPRIAGEIVAVQYVKTDFAAGVDFAITSEATGETIWAESDVNVSKACYPRAAVHTTVGVAALYAAGGVAVLDKIGLASDRVKISIAQGGNAKIGTFHVVVSD